MPTTRLFKCVNTDKIWPGLLDLVNLVDYLGEVIIKELLFLRL